MSNTATVWSDYATLREKGGDDATLNIPADALRATIGELEFKDNGENAKTAPIRLVARSGQPIEHWYFGRVVHDFAGMQHKSKIPIDYVHDEKEVLGFVNKFPIEDNDLVLSGALVPFKDSDRATEIIHKNRLGVPYEASIDFRDQMKMEFLSEGQVATVNDNQVEGPATIIREWTLRGVAVCPYGADPNTSSKLSNTTETIAVKVSTLTDQSGSSPPAEGDKPVEATPEAKPVEATEQTQETEADPPVEAETELEPAVATAGKKFVEAFGSQGAVWFVEGKSFDECASLFAKSQTDRIAQLEADNTELKKRLAAFSPGEQTPVSFDPSGDDKPRGRFSGRISVPRSTVTHTKAAAS